MKWRSLVVDDEAPARSHLRELLSAHSCVEVLGEASCVADAAQFYEKHQPNLLFLDLQMPRGLGFDLLSLIHPVPEVIFVTAYNEYAVRAFEVGAVDYLLKPIFADRLAIAINRLGLHDKERKPGSVEELSEDCPVFIRTDKGLRAVLVNQVTHVEAAGNYSTIWLESGASHLTDRTMHEWETILPSPRFQRLDRSLLVNTAQLRGIQNVSRDVSHLLVGPKDTPVKIGRAARSRLRILHLFR